ncbi:PREDICTED: uncharacterized protein LOC109116492 [Tarenaya hassleriana]|uniref:uncharacterized protein LOC109116492 n=1 Tax=Tarenaya hassleriana TaxID=28532 RepID=UPI0008FCF42A|nr:PREDICTED: uncharacterized protein LOC109116492 [Tarenaya hassleriana]
MCACKGGECICICNYVCIYICVSPGFLGLMRQLMESMKERAEKLKRSVRQQRAKLYIMRVCITMLLCWDDNGES